MEKQLIEFQDLKATRDNYYFGIGFASWEVKGKRHTYYVNAIYRETEMYENEATKDYTKGIKGFELQDSKFNTIKQFKVKAKAPIVSVKEVEEYIKKIDR